MRRIRGRIVVWLGFQGVLKLILSALLLCIAGLMLTREMPVAKTWTYWSMPLSGRTIAIDAGHGGPDGGATSEAGAIEKQINLAIALDLRDYLQQAGALVVMTRESDTDLARPDTQGLSRRKTEDLHNRADVVANRKADLLLSIHMNAMPSSRWRGAQTFYYPNHPDNKLLAELVQAELTTNLANTDRLAQTKNSVFLLKSSKVPSVLVEVGFLSNPQEAELLSHRDYQKKVAASIYRAILRYVSGEKAAAL